MQALPAQVHQLARVPVAVGPVPVVEGQDNQPGVGESFGEFADAPTGGHPADRGKPEAEHDGGRGPGWVGRYSVAAQRTPPDGKVVSWMVTEVMVVSFPWSPVRIGRGAIRRVPGPRSVQECGALGVT